jgi:hypothetical protein
MNQSEKTCVTFRDSLSMVYPNSGVSEEDFALLTRRWELKAAEKWASRRREPLRSAEGLSLLPISDAVCVVVSVVREWQADEQQEALRVLEARLKQLRAFDDAMPEETM